MEEIKVADIMFVKTTGEPVQVLEVGQERLKVRRPVVTNKGIEHQVGTFFAFELQTEGEKYESDLHTDYMQYQRQMKMVEMTTPKVKEVEELAN